MCPDQPHLFLNGPHKIDRVWRFDAFFLQPSKDLQHHRAAHAVVHRLSGVTAVCKHCERAPRHDRISRTDTRPFSLHLGPGTHIQKDLIVREDPRHVRGHRNMHTDQPAYPTDWPLVGKYLPALVDKSMIEPSTQSLKLYETFLRCVPDNRTNLIHVCCQHDARTIRGAGQDTDD